MGEITQENVTDVKNWALKICILWSIVKGLYQTLIFPKVLVNLHFIILGLLFSKYPEWTLEWEHKYNANIDEVLDVLDDNKYDPD